MGSVCSGRRRHGALRTTPPVCLLIKCTAENLAFSLFQFKDNVAVLHDAGRDDLFVLPVREAVLYNRHQEGFGVVAS